MLAITLPGWYLLRDSGEICTGQELANDENGGKNKWRNKGRLCSWLDAQESHESALLCKWHQMIMVKCSKSQRRWELSCEVGKFSHGTMTRQTFPFKWKWRWYKCLRGICYLCGGFSSHWEQKKAFSLQIHFDYPKGHTVEWYWWYVRDNSTVTRYTDWMWKEIFSLYVRIYNWQNCNILQGIYRLLD